MTVSLYDLLRRDVRKMVSGQCNDEKGNIYPLIMQEVERSLIGLVLEETNNNYFRAAKALGISRSTLYRKIETLGFEEE